MTRAGTSCSTCSLVCARLGDPLDLERLDAGGRVIGSLFGPTAVDHVADTGDGEGCFGNVGGDDDESMTFGRRLEYPELLVV